MIELNSQNFNEISKWSLGDINKLFQRQIKQSKYPGIFQGISFYHNVLFYTMSSVCKEDIPNVKEQVIKIIHKVFNLTLKEIKNLNECFNSKAELKEHNNGKLYIYKGTCSISLSFSFFQSYSRTRDKLDIDENHKMKLTSLLEDLFKFLL